jgi:hypothetical protein
MIIVKEKQLHEGLFPSNVLSFEEFTKWATENIGKNIAQTFTIFAKINMGYPWVTYSNPIRILYVGLNDYVQFGDGKGFKIDLYQRDIRTFQCKRNSIDILMKNNVVITIR